MARDLLGIPATSTPAERIFSRAGIMYTKSRNRLLGDAAQALMNLGSWWGGQGLPGVQVPIFDHTTKEEGEEEERTIQQLPKVVEEEDGKITYKEDAGWEKEFDDMDGEGNNQDAKRVGKEDMEDVEEGGDSDLVKVKIERGDLMVEEDDSEEEVCDDV